MNLRTIRGTRDTTCRGTVVRRFQEGKKKMVAEPPTATTRGEASETIVFRRLVQGLLKAKFSDREKLFEMVVERLRKARQPGLCINVLLDECALNSGPDGLGIGIDVLSCAGSAVLETTKQFEAADARVRTREGASSAGVPRVGVHDDVWYVLLRSVARIEAPPLTRMSIVCRAIVFHPSVAVKIAGVEALGDLNSSLEEKLPAINPLLHFLASTGDERVRNTAAAVLADMEG